jgi:hypothetical protein
MSSSTGQRPPIDEVVGRAHRLSSMSQQQHGVFTRDQAVEAGYTTFMIDRRVAEGEWVRAGRSVLATAHAPITYRHAAMAAVLSIDGAVASHETAATFQEFRYLANHPIAISVPPESWQRLHRVEVHRYRDLAPEWVTQIHGIPMTTPARTMIDLAAVVRGPRLERILDSALDHRQVDIDELQRTFNRLARKGRRGIGPIRSLLEARGDGVAATQSELERRFLLFNRKHGYPEPAKQLPIFWAERLIGLADFAYPEQQALIELDGRLGHTQLLDRELDNLRDQRARAAGWSVTRITWRQLHEHPDQVIDVLDRLHTPGSTNAA